MLYLVLKTFKQALNQANTALFNNNIKPVKADKTIIGLLGRVYLRVVYSIIEVFRNMLSKNADIERPTSKREGYFEVFRNLEGARS